MQRSDFDRLARFGYPQNKKYPHSFLTLVRQVLSGGKLPCSRAWRSSCRCWSPQAWSSRRGPWACAPSCQVVGRRTTTASWWAGQPCRSTTSSTGAPRLPDRGRSDQFLPQASHLAECSLPRTNIMCVTQNMHEGRSCLGRRCNNYSCFKIYVEPVFLWSFSHLAWVNCFTTLLLVLCVCFLFQLVVHNSTHSNACQHLSHFQQSLHFSIWIQINRLTDVFLYRFALHHPNREAWLVAYNTGW